MFILTRLFCVQMVFPEYHDRESIKNKTLGMSFILMGQSLHVGLSPACDFNFSP